MPRTKHSSSEEELWFSLARDKGLEVLQTDRETVYNIDEKITNVKYSQVQANRGRFSLGREYLEENEFFVFICGKHSIFYVIPRDVMRNLAKITTSDANTNRPVFNINIKKHKYYPGKSLPVSIVEYYQRWDLFEDNATFQKEVEKLEPSYSRQVEKLSQDELDQKLSKFHSEATELIDPSDRAKRRLVNQYRRSAELSALLKAKFNYT